MLAIFAACAALLSGSLGHQSNPGSELVSKMLKYYYNAKSLTGTINLTASDGAGQVQVATYIQFEGPSKLFIRQVKSGGNPREWLVTSDGTHFSYETPDNLLGGSQRLVDNVHSADGNYDVRKIYAVAAASSIGDRSVPLDIAIGRPEDLKHDSLTWMTVEADGQVSVDGTAATVVKGKWRPYGNATTDLNSPLGTYEMVIADDGRLLRYTIFQNIPKDPRNPNDYVRLQETWEVRLTLNGKPDPNLFKVVR